jgi:amino acid permease
MLAVFPILYVGYKVVRKTRILRPEEVDLAKDLDIIEEYERNYIPKPPAYVLSAFFSCVRRKGFANVCPPFYCF